MVWAYSNYITTHARVSFFKIRIRLTVHRLRPFNKGGERNTTGDRDGIEVALLAAGPIDNEIVRGGKLTVRLAHNSALCFNPLIHELGVIVLWLGHLHPL